MIDTTDLDSYIAGYDEYCDTSKPVYSTDEYYSMKEELEGEIQQKEQRIDDLLDKLSWIKDKLNEIKTKNYEPTIEDIKYIEEIVKEEE